VEKHHQWKESIVPDVSEQYGLIKKVVNRFRNWLPKITFLSLLQKKSVSTKEKQILKRFDTSKPDVLTFFSIWFPEW